MGVVWRWHLLVNLCVFIAHHFTCLSLNPLNLSINRKGWWFEQCFSCWFDYQQRVLKTFPGPSYLHSKDGVVWLWQLVLNLFILLTVSSCYSSIPWTLMLIGMVVWALCHSCGFGYQQKVLKTFPGPGYLLSEDEVV